MCSAIALLAAVLQTRPAAAQSIGNQTVTGKYYFRHVSLGTDSKGSITDARSMLGSITFDGTGRFTFSGQQVQANNSPTSASGSGAYAIDSAGLVTLDNPIRSGGKINARVAAIGPQALLGSSTESSANVFDLFVAVPAPAANSNPTLTGPYWVATLDFPGGVVAYARTSIFSLASRALGRLQDFYINGHASNLGNGQPFTDAVIGAVYTLAADGSGTFSFGPYNNNSLLSGNHSFYLSADGNILLGGASSLHNIIVGVKSTLSPVTNAAWSGTYWTAGLRFDLAPLSGGPDVETYVGSTSSQGSGTLRQARRIKALASGSYDFTGINSYSLTASSSGLQELNVVGVGINGVGVVGSALSAQDPNAYELYLSLQLANLTGTGVFLNTRGVTSAASYFPPGAPIAPGEFIGLYGTGLAPGEQTAAPPYPSTLNGVSISINGAAAPVRYVSANQIVCLVPYAAQGSTATITVQNGSAASNTVTVPLAATAPSVFTLDQSGVGLGAILHADYTPVNSSKPAAAGETVQVFLTGLGAVTPGVPDGTAGGSNPVSRTIASPISVLIGGTNAQVSFSGLAPGFPGLYQMNVTVPSYASGPATLPLAITTPNAVHDQVDIAVK